MKAPWMSGSRLTRILALLLILVIATGAVIAAGAPATANASLTGGKTFGCGLGYGAAAGLGVGGIWASGTIVGLPAGAVLGTAGVLVVLGTTLACA